MGFGIDTTRFLPLWTPKSAAPGQTVTRSNRLVQNGHNTVDLQSLRRPHHAYRLAVNPGAVYRNRKATVGLSNRTATAALIRARPLPLQGPIYLGHSPLMYFYINSYLFMAPPSILRQRRRIEGRSGLQFTYGSLASSIRGQTPRRGPSALSSVIKFL
jgi:hypothetical protein